MSSIPLLALALCAPQGGEPITAQTEHFEIICHLPSERAVEEAEKVLEQVSKVAGQIYDLSHLDLAGPLQVTLYPNLQAYEDAEQSLTGGAFAKNGAFSHFDSKSAHVALQPVISNALLKRSGLPKQTLRMIAHEAAHLLRYALFNNYRSHPRWIADGAASWIDQEVMESLGYSAGLERDPHVTAAIVGVQRLIEAKELPSIEDLLAGEFSDLSFSDPYYITRLFFGFLFDGSHKERLAKIIKGPLHRLGGGRNFVSRLRKEFKKTFGKVSVRKLDKEFRKYIGTLHPEWSQTFRSLETHGDVWRQMAFRDANAVAWRTESVKSKEYEISGEFEVLDAGRGQVNLLLDRDDKGFVSIAFSPGALTIFHYHSRSNEWEQLLARKVEGLGINVPYEFRIEVTGKRLQVFLRGEELAGLTVKGRKLHGPWGIGVQAGGAALWHGIKGPGID